MRWLRKFCGGDCGPDQTLVVVTALFGWLAKKGVNYVDTKTRLWMKRAESFRKDAVKERIVDTVTTVARATPDLRR